MKKFLVSASLLTALLSGCASAPSPWAGIPYEERQAWSGIGVNGYEAKQLRQNGFTPMDTSEWIKLGIRSPASIMSWYRAGFSAKQASKWLAKGLSLQEAIHLTE
ncbi:MULTISPECIES: hypothetical protein [unclassified Pseudoalteromonas]|uniref:hypothetical protein n=1 Tax=unclassified Pseudoalteromonas TaxID=194690 RepID=UPI003014C271